MSEIWKPVSGYEDYYEISSSGKLRSKDRFVIFSDGRKRTFKGKTINPRILPSGYVQFSLSINDKNKYIYAHRLVATAFIKNPDNKPQINHIDENKQNNCAENLEWVTQSENMRHNNLQERIQSKINHKAAAKKINQEKRTQKFKKSIIQKDKDGSFIKNWSGIVDASRKLNIDKTNIWSVLNNIHKTAGGFKWEYKKV